MADERLSKLLAAAGVASRRAVDALIESGRVTVDGRAGALGERIDPERAASRSTAAVPLAGAAARPSSTSRSTSRPASFRPPAIAMPTRPSSTTSRRASRPKAFGSIRSGGSIAIRRG